MDSQQFLLHVAGVLRRRGEQYGDVDACFRQIALRWSLVLGIKISPAQVALCMLELKMARLARDPADLDGQTDIAGYAACLREVTRNV